ncbi:MAG TPA: calcium-binding protein, partial [Rhizomicrobium sp.]|nr:calcium-binding protein [Rhizomicrobium sp.]
MPPPIIATGDLEDGAMEFIGTSGDDDLAGTTGDDLFRMGKGGDDIVFGDAGRDILKFYGTLTAADRIDGGAGADAVRLDGEYTGANALVFTATTMVNVEGLTLAGRENSYDLTTVDATVTAGQTLRVSGDSLTSGHTLTFDGSAETDGHFRISDGAGDDVLTGGGQSDLFSLYKGGNDTVSGGIGADAFAMRGTFTADDRIAGGAGQDHIRLGGDYAGANALVFRASTMVGIERIGVHGAHDYDLTVVDANVAANAQLEVFGRDLQAGHTLKFDGSAETDGYFLLTGGGGDDVLIGGRLGDVFDLTQGGTDTVSGGNGDDIIRMGRTLRSNDSIDGGAGSDTLNLNGDYPNRIALGPTSIRNIETIFVAAHHSYELTLDNANVASGQLLTIDGSALDAGNTLIVHGAAETDGRFALIGGAGDDTLTGGARADTFDLSEGGDDTARGGAGNDTFDFGGAFTSGDNVDGGAGSNTLTMTGDANGALSDANVTHISKVILNGNGLSFLQVTGDITGGAGMLTVDASAATFGEADFTGATSSSYHFIGGDSPVGAYGVTIGANIHQSDIFDGGSGLHDGIVLEGDFSGGYTFGAQNLLHMETVLLQAGFGYVLTTVDANVASGTTLTVDGGDVLAADTFQFDGSAETNGHFNLVGSVGNDVLTGGGMSDTFDLTRGGDDTVQGGGGDDTINIGDKLTADDRIDGGTGTNTVVLSGFYADGAPPPAVFDEAMVTNISHVELVGSSSAALIGVIGDITGGAGTLTISGALSQSIFAALYQATSAGYNFLGSSGDDYIGFANNLHSTDVIDGGGSSDTLSLSG